MFERKVTMKEFQELRKELVELFDIVKQQGNVIETMNERIKQQDHLIAMLNPGCPSKTTVNKQDKPDIDNNPYMASTQDDGASLANAMLIAAAISSSYSDTSSSTSTSYDSSSCDSSSYDSSSCSSGD